MGIPGIRLSHSVLYVFQGSGYLTACFAYACRSDAHVLGIEKHQDLVLQSIENIQKADSVLMSTNQVEVRCGNALDGMYSLQCTKSTIVLVFPRHPLFPSMFVAFIT